MTDKQQQDKAKMHEQQRILAREVRFLRARIDHELGFKVSLVFQKRYLLHLIGGIDLTYILSPCSDG
jgi:hypothetical protein